MPPAVEAWSPNHGTAREIPGFLSHKSEDPATWDPHSCVAGVAGRLAATSFKQILSNLLSSSKAQLGQQSLRLLPLHVLL